jgi:hypothetical protein
VNYSPPLSIFLISSASLLFLFFRFLHSFTQVQNVVKVTRWLASGGVSPLEVTNHTASWRRVCTICNDASRREKLVVRRARGECKVTKSWVPQPHTGAGIRKEGVWQRGGVRGGRGGGTAKISRQVFKSTGRRWAVPASLAASSRETSVYVRRTWGEINLTAGSTSTNQHLLPLFRVFSQVSGRATEFSRIIPHTRVVLDGVVKTPACWYNRNPLRLEFSAFGVFSHSYNFPRPTPQPTAHTMMAVAAAQKNREMFAIKKSYSIEVSPRYT